MRETLGSVRMGKRSHVGIEWRSSGSLDGVMGYEYKERSGS